MCDASTVEVPGPLGPHGPGFCQELGRLGYSRWTAYALMLLMADLSRWMAAHKVGLAEFDTRCVEPFLKDRREQVRRCG